MEAHKEIAHFFKIKVTPTLDILGELVIPVGFG
jgi:hypothetical protein